jgi:RNAse (barnase) inhibitor barstar
MKNMGICEKFEENEFKRRFSGNPSMGEYRVKNLAELWRKLTWRRRKTN